MGISSAKATTIGKPSVQRSQNGCNFLLVAEDEPVAMADAIANSAEPSNNFDTDSGQSSWVPLEDHHNSNEGQDVQRTIAGLVIGSTSQTTYGSGDVSSGGGYVNSESISTGPDSGLSPDTSNSNRPTPNSTTPSDTRSNLRAGLNNNSNNASYETSPATSAQNTNSGPQSHQRSMDNFFASNPDYSNISSTGLTPDNTFSMPETPGRDFPVPQGWEQTTGLTPVGEGVFRHLMGLGPMEPNMEAMDLGWEGA